MVSVLARALLVGIRTKLIRMMKGMSAIALVHREICIIEKTAERSDSVGRQQWKKTRGRSSKGVAGCRASRK